METSASCPNIYVSSKSERGKGLEDELVCLTKDVNETSFRPKSHSKGNSFDCNIGTVFENHRRSRIQHCERSELR